MDGRGTDNTSRDSDFLAELIIWLKERDNFKMDAPLMIKLQA